MSAEPRRYALARVRAGDYLLIGNDQRTIWRITRHLPAHAAGHGSQPGWGLWRHVEPYDGNGYFPRSRDELEDWTRWIFVAGPFAVRDDASDATLDPAHQPRWPEKAPN